MSGYGDMMNFTDNTYATKVYVTSNTLDRWVTRNSNASMVCRTSNDLYDKVYLPGCFPKSELVHTTFDACVPIGSLKMGDKISFWDVERQKKQYTAVTEIHKYTVMDLICFNNAMRVSSTHPLMVMDHGEHGIITPKWKVAFDVNIGDYVIGSDGKWFTIKSKSRHWYDTGIEVLSLSTDNGVPFMVGNCVVRAENATDNLEWADAPTTQKYRAETSITHESLTEAPLSHKLVA